MTNSDEARKRVAAQGNRSGTSERVRGVLTGQVPVDSAPIAMNPRAHDEEDAPDDDEDAGSA